MLDLSDNPLNPEAFTFGTFQLTENLEYLNLSGTSLRSITDLFELNNLTHLLLNDVVFTEFVFDNQTDVLQILNNNPRISHLGLNGIQLSDPNLFLEQLFFQSSRQVLFESLELSDTGIEFLPNFDPAQLIELEVLDLSDNPLNPEAFTFGIFQLTENLESLDLSNANLSNLDDLLSLTSLRSLFLNSDDPVNYSIQTLNQIILNNELLVELGLNGIQLQSDVDLILNTIADSSIVDLGIANVGITNLLLPELLIERLQSLDVSSNGLTELPNLELAQQLESLVLDDNSFVDIGALLVDLPSLNFLSLLNNSAIACEDLELLANQFGNDVRIINPEDCGVVEEPEPEPVDAAALYALISFILLEEEVEEGVESEGAQN